MDEKFDFLWHSFQAHTDELLSELYSSACYSDVTLVCDDQTQFRAHKFVLSACSRVFRNILSNDVSSPFIYLRGVANEEMESILQFMYLGKAICHQDRMTEFLNVAKDLDVREILKEIGEDMNNKEETSEEDEKGESDKSESIQTNEEIMEYDASVTGSINVSEISDASERQNFICQHCHSSYKLKKSFQQHLRTKHRGIVRVSQR